MKVNGFDLRTFIRANISRERKTPESLAFMSWAKTIYQTENGWVLHHIAGSDGKKKINDFLLCPMPDLIHQKIENGQDVSGYSIEEQILKAIELLITYNKYLYNKLSGE